MLSKVTTLLVYNLLLFRGYASTDPVGTHQTISQVRTSCPVGMTLETNGKCLDINECSVDNGGCEHTCHNLIGSYMCSCPMKYDLLPDGRRCAPWGALERARQQQPDLSSIATSLCSRGFYMNKEFNLCLDINECEFGLSDCDHNCQNHEGGYTCSCDDGFIITENNHSCKRKSTGIKHSQTTGSTTPVFQSPTSSHRKHPPPPTVTRQTTQKATTSPKFKTVSATSISTPESSTVIITTPSTKTIKTSGPGFVRTQVIPSEGKPFTVTKEVDGAGQIVPEQVTNGVRPVSCRQGLQLTSDGLACQDVNECALGLHNCEQSCQNLIGGYLCSCQAGMILDRDQSSCLPLDEITTITKSPVLVFGSHPNNLGICASGYSITATGDDCIDIDECASDISGCSQICSNWPGGFSCSCTREFYLHEDQHNCVPSVIAPIQQKLNFTPVSVSRKSGDGLSNLPCSQGYHITSNGVCEDIDECLSGPLKCSQICNNWPGHYTCSCSDGYYLSDDQFTCVELDIERHPLCKDGYAASSGHCVDINECSLGTHVCDQICNNWPGAYTCACNSEYYLAEDQKGCLPLNVRKVTKTSSPQITPNHIHNVVKKPREERVTSVVIAPPVLPNAREKIVSSSSEVVKTPDGVTIVRSRKSETRPDGTQTVEEVIIRGSEDGVRTRFHPTSESQVKLVHESGYMAPVGVNGDCSNGYELLGSGEQCADVDECASGRDLCQQICRNWPGHYTCACTENHYLDTDQFTCFPFTDKTKGKLLNPASKDHICPAGFTITNDGITCTDIDECSSGIHKCSQYCENTAGGYECFCEGGFLLAEDELSCIDQSLILPTETLPIHVETRFLSSPDHVGSCTDGYQITEVGDCIDVDECLSGLDRCSQICNNWPGHYTCECDTEYYLHTDQVTCIRRSDDRSAPRVITPPSSQGKCPAGYSLTATNMCQDVDECLNQRVACNQLCNNRPGGYTCGCDEGYYLAEDQHSCVPIGVPPIPGVPPPAQPGQPPLPNQCACHYEINEVKRQAEAIRRQAEEHSRAIINEVLLGVQELLGTCQK